MRDDYRCSRFFNVLRQNEWIRINWQGVAPIRFVILLSDAKQGTKIILKVLSNEFSVEG